MSRSEAAVNASTNQVVEGARRSIRAGRPGLGTAAARTAGVAAGRPPDANPGRGTGGRRDALVRIMRENCLNLKRIFEYSGRGWNHCGLRASPAARRASGVLCRPAPTSSACGGAPSRAMSGPHLPAVGSARRVAGLLACTTAVRSAPFRDVLFALVEVWAEGHRSRRRQSMPAVTTGVGPGRAQVGPSCGGSKGRPRRCPSQPARAGGRISSPGVGGRDSTRVSPGADYLDRGSKYSRHCTAWSRATRCRPRYPHLPFLCLSSGSLMELLVHVLRYYLRWSSTAPPLDDW